MDGFDDSSSSPSGTLRNYPLTCKVVYSYQVRTWKIRSFGWRAKARRSLVCIEEKGVDIWPQGETSAWREWLPIKDLN